MLEKERDERGRGREGEKRTFVYTMWTEGAEKEEGREKKEREGRTKKSSCRRSSEREEGETAVVRVRTEMGGI